MKIKFLSVLAILAVGAAAVFTNCGKEAHSFTPPGTETAAERAICNISITTNAAVQVCGTQTNATYCNGTINPNSYGVEIIGPGTVNRTITTPSVLSFTNLSAATTVKITVVTAAGTYNIPLPGSTVDDRWLIDAGCGLTDIP